MKLFTISENHVISGNAAQNLGHHYNTPLPVSVSVCRPAASLVGCSFIGIGVLFHCMFQYINSPYLHTEIWCLISYI